MQPELVARAPGGAPSDDHAPSLHRVFEEIERQVGARNFKHWFRDKVTLSLDGRDVVLGIGTSFLVAWMQKNFFAPVSQAVHATLGGDFAARFVLSEKQPEAALQPTSAAPEPQATAETSLPTIDERSKSVKAVEGFADDDSPIAEPCVDAAEPMTPQIARVDAGRSSGMRRFADLADFVQGPCNELALTAARQICMTPGVRFNPLVIYGNAGTGKTHLLEGIYRLMRRRHPSQQVLYLTAESFANYFTQALKEHTLPSFRQRFRGVDVLLVDDVDFFDGKRVFQEEFLHTFQQLESHGR
ncbi:MAG: DnaA/Hda family protein, partial [Planctomycetaceae bacterium]